MAKYNVTYKCGHTVEVQLYGKESERQRKIAWYATINCHECEAKAHAAKAEAAGLPALEGSEKQIEWATRLRNNALSVLDNAMAGMPEANRPLMEDLRSQWISKEVKASYWIDNRFDLDTLPSVLNLVQTSTNYNA